MGWVLGFIVWGLALSGNLGYIGGGIDLSYGQCARSQGWPRSPYHLLWFGCYRSPGRDGRMKNRFGRLHLGCLQWCLVEECGKLRVSCCRGVKPRQPSRVFTRRAALYGGHAQARQLIKSAAALRLTSAHQASRWTGGFAAVARALSGMSNVQCDSLDSATTDVLARARLRHPNLHQARPCRLLRINGDNVRGDGLSAHRRTLFSVLGTLCGIALERLCSADTAAREHFCFEAEMWRAVASRLLLLK